MIECAQIAKRYVTPTGPVEVLSEVSLSVPSGTLTALMGPSGSGKSTLIRLMAGLDTPDSGSIMIDGREVGAFSRSARARLRLESIGVVFQDHTLIPELTALENVALPIRGLGVSRRDANAQALAAMDELSIGEFADRRPAELSGGQQQRVGVARAFVGGRRVILADEPTGSLDRASSDVVFDTLLAAVRQGAAVVVATHDTAIREWADRVVLVDDGRLTEAT